MGRERGYPLGACGLPCDATMRMAPSRSHSPYPAPITASKREEKAVTSGRSNEDPVTGNTGLRDLGIISARQIVVRSAPSPQALRLRRTAHAAMGLDRSARPNEWHPCLDGISMPIADLVGECSDGSAVAAANNALDGMPE